MTTPTTRAPTHGQAARMSPTEAWATTATTTTTNNNSCISEPQILAFEQSLSDRRRMFESCASRTSQKASKWTTVVTTTTTTTDYDDGKKATTTTAGLAPSSASHRGGTVFVGAARRLSKVLILESENLGVPQKECWPAISLWRSLRAQSTCSPDEICEPCGNATWPGAEPE